MELESCENETHAGQDGRSAVQSQLGQMRGIISGLERNDPKATSRLLPIVYAELRRLAAHYMRGERQGQTIQPTDLVHEAYLRLAGQQRIDWQGRTHFLAMAATCMRRILVDRARRKNAEKHGGEGEKIQLDEAVVFSPDRSNEILALDDALKRLAELSPRQSRTVDLRFFGGLTIEEIAQIEGVSPRTVKQDWKLARAWIHREIATTG
jgi:RNA polymerase sigma-70 factor (ECF subfamily)